MQLTNQIAKHLREVHMGGNWTASNLQDQLAEVTWQQATTSVESFHDIASLVYHMNYFVAAILAVHQGKPLEAKDALSFDRPPISSQEEWDALKDKTWKDAESLAKSIEQLPQDRLGDEFVEPKYGNYCRNLLGVIEHCHYHLGQIALIKSMLSQPASKPA